MGLVKKTAVVNVYISLLNSLSLEAYFRRSLYVSFSVYRHYLPSTGTGNSPLDFQIIPQLQQDFNMSHGVERT